MNEAPEKIYFFDTPEKLYVLPSSKWGWPKDEPLGKDDTCYIRADLVPQWLPIESAPKDGSDIDIWCVHHSDKKGFLFTGMFFNERGRWEDWHGYELEQKWIPTHYIKQLKGPNE